MLIEHIFGSIKYTLTEWHFSPSKLNIKGMYTRYSGNCYIFNTFTFEYFYIDFTLFHKHCKHQNNVYYLLRLQLVLLMPKVVQETTFKRLLPQMLLFSDVVNFLNLSNLYLYLIMLKNFVSLLSPQYSQYQQLYVHHFNPLTP